jgi:hypothetical protein
MGERGCDVRKGMAERRFEYLDWNKLLVYLFLCGSHNKQQLFHYTALTDWFINREFACLLRGAE